MSPDEALGLAQILLAILFFALGGTTFIIETSERIRPLLHKHLPRKPFIFLTVLNFVAVVGLIALAGYSFKDERWRVVSEFLAKGGTVLILGLFAILGIRMLRIDLRTWVIGKIQKSISDALLERGSFAEADLEDLVLLGEDLRGAQKNVVIAAIGELAVAAQSSPRYDGNELEGIIQGLQRVLQTSEPAGLDENYRRAIEIIGASWRRLVSKGFAAENDARVLREAACAIGEASVKNASDAIILRCMAAIPNNVETPFRVGAAAVKQRRFRIALAALNRLESIAAAENRLPGQLIALVAHLCELGGVAARHARDFGARLHRSAEEIERATGDAAAGFYAAGDFAAADAVNAHLLTHARG